MSVYQMILFTENNFSHVFNMLILFLLMSELMFCVVLEYVT